MKPTTFFKQSTTDVARQLVGCYLVAETDAGTKRLQITETEAYLGPEDAASHARFGRTERSEIMFGPPAIIYVYLIYGMYYMLNIVTREADKPGAVLIRGVEGFDGPGKLTEALGISKEQYNGAMLGAETGLWIEARPDDFDAEKIQALPRVGIDYAAERWREEKLRFKLVATT